MEIINGIKGDNGNASTFGSGTSDDCLLGCGTYCDCLDFCLDVCPSLCNLCPIDGEICLVHCVCGVDFSIPLE